MARSLPFLFTALLLSSCSLVPDYTSPAVEAPAWETARDEAGATQAADWWGKFGNAELAELVKQALVENYDMQASLARVAQSRASVQVADASLLPAMDASASAGRDFTRPRRGANSSETSYRAGLDVGYELDLFGRNRASVGAAQASAEATSFDREALKLVVASDTAQAFINLLTLEERLKIATDNLALVQDVLNIAQARFDAGTISALELAQQKNALANSQAGIASLEQQKQAARNQLAVLLGKPPQGFGVTSKTLADFTAPTPALVQPADLLARRPDIRASEAQLQAANYDIGAARAAFFPSLQLSADMGIAANPASAPATLAGGFGASLAQPLFRGGALEGQLTIAKERKAELEAQYRQTVLVAFQEVQNALAAEASAQERMKQFAIAQQEAQKAYALARQRFDAGIIDFQTLIETQRSLLSAQDSLIVARQDQLFSAIDLFKAMGGGFEG